MRLSPAGLGKLIQDASIANPFTPVVLVLVPVPVPVLMLSEAVLVIDWVVKTASVDSITSTSTVASD